MISAERVRATVQAYVDGWRSGDRSAWLALFTDDATLTDPVGQPALEGKEAIAAFWDNVHQLPLTFHPDVQRIAVCGNEAMLLFRMDSLADGGGGMQIDVVDIFTLNEDARITQMRAYWDEHCQRMVGM